MKGSIMKKRIVSSVLALTILVTLNACGNSQVKEVEGFITQIGKVTKEISAEQEEAITAATEAYNSLSDNEKKQVSNYDLLHEARYKLEMSKMTNTMTYWNYCCDYVANAVEQIWSVEGADHVIGTFAWVLNFDDADKSIDDYCVQSPTLSNFSKSELSIMLWGIARSLNPKEYSDNYYSEFEGKGERGTIEICAQICVAYNNISEAQAYFPEAIDTLKSDFSETHNDEIAQFVEWYIESDLYADFVKEPSGSLLSYRESHDQFQKSMDRYKKVAESNM